MCGRFKERLMCLMFTAQQQQCKYRKCQFIKLNAEMRQMGLEATHLSSLHLLKLWNFFNLEFIGMWICDTDYETDKRAVYLRYYITMWYKKFN